MKNPWIAYFSALLFLAVADLIWLGLLMNDHYQAWIGPLMREQPLLLPAVAFYLLYPLGLVVFAILPALEKRSSLKCAALSALFGLVAYGTYDLSNLATLKDWPWQLAMVDILWGTALSCGAAMTGYFTARAWGKHPHG